VGKDRKWEVAPEDRIGQHIRGLHPGQHIRGLHPYHFRTGQWAVITDIVKRPFGLDLRECYHVRFPDGQTDYWAVDGGWEYEFTDDEGRIASEEPDK
jgi:hypothetical protein